MLNLKALNNQKKIFIVIISALIFYKLLILIIKGPLFLPDSFHYIEYASRISDFNFVSPDAIRTPGYPLLISFFSIAGSYQFISVILFQIILGLISLFFLYKLFKDTRYSAFVLPLLLLIYISPISFSELEIISESLSFFLLVVLLYFIFKKNTSGVDFIWIGLIAILLILTRPQYSIITFILGSFLLFNKKKTVSLILIAAAVFTFSVYSYFNYLKNNYIGMTSLVSFNLINHTGYYIEKGRWLNPDLVDIYIEHRNKVMDVNNGRQEFTFGGVKDTLMKTLNMNYIELSGEMDRINYYLITEFPLDYFSTFYHSFINLFTYEFYDYKATRLAKYLISFSKILFSLGLLLSFLKFKDKDLLNKSLLLILFSSILLSVIIDTGETFRHIMPVSFIPFIFLLEYFFKYIIAGKSKRNTQPVSVS